MYNNIEIPVNYLYSTKNGKTNNNDEGCDEPRRCQ
jgi:hypothetical protein